MKKFAGALVLTALFISGVACSGSSDKSAKDLYNSYVAHYGYVADEFGVTEGETFEQYAEGLDDCEPIDGEGTAMLTLLVGSTLTDHGDDVAGFVGDTNELLAAVKAEGLCGSSATNVAPTPTTEPPTTTTTVNTAAILQEEMESSCYGEVWDGMKELSDGATALASTGVPTAISTARDSVRVMQDSVDVCEGIVSSDMTSAMQDLTDATDALIDLYATN